MLDYTKEYRLTQPIIRGKVRLALLMTLPSSPLWLGGSSMGRPSLLGLSPHCFRQREAKRSSSTGPD